MYILFSRRATIGSFLIKLLTWSNWSHVDVIDRDELIGSLMFEGVVRIPIKERLANSSKYAVLKINTDTDRAMQFIKAQIGKAYDWTAVVGIGFHRDWQEDDAWFCSELIAAALANAGTPVIRGDKYVRRITPEMLWESPLFEPVEDSSWLPGW